MKNFSLFFVLIALIFFISLWPTYSQTIIPGGYVSGMWTAANSPFQINGDITVHTDSALTIEPGVEVIFQGHYPFIINGILNAVGTETDSIRFTAAIPDTGWRGLRFINSADTSHLAYCIIEYGKATTGIGFEYRRGGGIYVNSSLPPEISHCSIRNNLADVYGGGICFYNVSNDTIFITDCDITNNKTTGFSGDGGGIYFYGPNLFVEMQNCIISHNVSSNGNGGGICYGGETYQPNLRLTDCTVNYNQSDDEGGGIWMKDLSFYLLDIINSDISYNLAVNNGGGIYAEATGSNHGLVNIFASTLVGNELTGTLGKGGAFYGDPGLYVPYSTFQYTTIAYNQAFEGGGLYLTTSWRLKLDHCTMANNTATTGSGLFIESSSGEVSIKNSILSLNSPAAIHNDGTILYLKYSDFYGNGINISGGVPAGFGQLVTTNYNGDSCDVGYNIFLDPLFEDPGSGNYQITWANWPTPDSTKSPCIDAGDPTSPLDPDNTISDMGAFSFDQSASIFEKEFFTGWNLVGLPLEVENPNYQILFPTSIPGTLFGYNIGYYSTDTLEVGTGYWLKFPGPGITPIFGTPILPPQSVELIAGWNMISGLSCNIAISDIGDPGSIIIPGSLYGYGPGYYSADSIKQGNGYWVKTSSAGYIDLSCTTELSKSRSNLAGNISDLSSFSRIEISDNSGSEQTLYFDGILEDDINLESFSLPPLPPEGSFDARLSGGYRVAETDEVLVQIQSSNYPLSIKVERLANKGASEYQITKLIGSEEVGEHSIFDGEKILISDPEIKFLKISKQQMIPIRFELSQNYPNPFNPITTIKFAVAKESNVNLNIYNVLGELVSTLVNEELKAGYYEYDFNASILASGVYLYRISAGDFVENKKMLLLK